MLTLYFGYNGIMNKSMTNFAVSFYFLKCDYEKNLKRHMQLISYLYWLVLT